MSGLTSEWLLNDPCFIDVVLLGCDAVWTWRQIPAFRLNFVSIFRAEVFRVHRGSKCVLYTVSVGCDWNRTVIMLLLWKWLLLWHCSNGPGFEPNCYQLVIDLSGYDLCIGACMVGLWRHHGGKIRQTDGQDVPVRHSSLTLKRKECLKMMKILFVGMF